MRIAFHSFSSKYLAEVLEGKVVLQPVLYHFPDRWSGWFGRGAQCKFIRKYSCRCVMGHETYYPSIRISFPTTSWAYGIDMRNIDIEGKGNLFTLTFPGVEPDMSWRENPQSIKIMQTLRSWRENSTFRIEMPHHSGY